MKKTIFLMIFSLLASVSVFNQEKGISREEYYKVFREASKIFYSASSRRQMTRKEYYKDGRLERTTEELTENIKPDRFKFVVIETSEKGKDKSELIRIGENYYCQKNDDGWKVSKSGCNEGGISGLPVKVSQFYVETVNENGKSFKVYRQYNIYVAPGTSAGGGKGFSYWEEKIHVSDDGLLLLTKTEDGLIDTKQIRSKSLTIYEYNPKDLKIEAPVK